MYVQSMTTDEMAREYHADLAEIDEFNKRIDSSSYVAKMFNKAKKAGRFCFARFYTTSRKNRYVNVYQYVKTKSTQQVARWDWSVCSMALMQTNKGVSVVSFFADATMAIVFQQHFFARYKQRLLEAGDWKTKNELLNATTTEKLIAVWARRNPNIIWMNTKTKFQDMEHIFAPIEDGIVLMQWDGKHIQANTFITKDMCSKKQLEMVTQAEDAKRAKEENQKYFKQLFDLISKNK